MTTGCAQASTSSDVRYSSGYHRHELNICVQWKARHVDDGPGDVIDIHRRLRPGRAVSLLDTHAGFFRKLGRGVANVDLTSGDVELPRTLE